MSIELWGFETIHRQGEVFLRREAHSARLHLARTLGPQIAPVFFRGALTAQANALNH